MYFIFLIIIFYKCYPSRKLQTYIPKLEIHLRTITIYLIKIIIFFTSLLWSL